MHPDPPYEQEPNVLLESVVMKLPESARTGLFSAFYVWEVKVENAKLLNTS